MAIVVGGGLLKYKNQFFNGIIGLVKAAEELKIPVAFNSIGIEGYDSNNLKCQELKKAIHNRAVKFISTRDDFSILYNKYFDKNPKIIVEKSVDPGIFAKDKYSPKIPNKCVIGIGVCRFSIFKEYGCKHTTKDIENLYYDVIKELTDSNYNVELFTNGASSDEEAIEVIKNRFLKNYLKISIKIPKSPKELINILSQYSLIVAPRMHSCIIGYSLNIPVIGMVWNRKHLFGYFGHYHPAVTAITTQFLGRDCTYRANAMQS